MLIHEQRFNIVLRNEVLTENQFVLAFRIAFTFSYGFADRQFFADHFFAMAAEAAQPVIYQNLFPESVFFTRITDVTNVEKLLSAGRDTIVFLSLNAINPTFACCLPRITYDFRRLRLPELSNLR